MQDAATKVEELEKRVAELEARLKRAPGEACPKCGALEFRVETSGPLSGTGAVALLGQMGAREHKLKCGECGYTDRRVTTPK